MAFTTKLVLCTTPTVEALESAIQDVCDAGAKSVLIFASAEDQWDKNIVDPLLTRLAIPIFGGIFPQIIHEGICLTQGTLVVGLNIIPALTILNNLSNEAELELALQTAKPVIQKSKSLLTITDGLVENLELLTDGLYSITGIQLQTLGCGAGFSDFVQRPCLFSNRGLLVDAAIIVALPVPFYQGVAHGWQVQDGPYLVTASNGNTLEMLNYAPAYEVYKEQVEKSTGLNFSEHDFYDIAKMCPLGLESMDGDMLVRDPVRLEEASLVCVGNIPQNTTVYLLKGDAENLIASAGVAANTAFNEFKQVNSGCSNDVLVFDCISRAMFLEQEFDRELLSIVKNSEGAENIFGALTLGEIASSKHGPIDLLNKSTIVAVF